MIIFTINKINDTKGDIRTLIGSSTFITKFLNKNELGPVYGDIYESGNTRHENNRMIVETFNEMDNSLEKEKKIDLIKNMTFRNIILSNQNGISLDWIVLYNKLTENWQPFKLFSYEIDDAQIVQKLVVIVLGFSAIIRLNFKIGF